MTAEITQADYDHAADLAALAERICFGGNDVAALRNRFTADNNILAFVRLVSAYRTQARDAALEEAKLPKVEFHQHDWIPAFAALVPGATTPAPGSTAFCVLNLQAFLEVVAGNEIPREELPYFVAESMMHEIIHVLEQWAGTEFNEDRVEALLAKYRNLKTTPTESE